MSVHLSHRDGAGLMRRPSPRLDLNSQKQDIAMQDIIQTRRLSSSLAATVSSPPRSLLLRRTNRSRQYGHWTAVDVQRATSSDVDTSSTTRRGDRSYVNVTGFPFPLGPYLERKTLRYEIEKDRIWTFEQPQSLGFSSVGVNIRMTVIKLNTGSLWIHAPIAPTEECLRLLDELNSPVEFIILPTFAYEHKIFVGPFSRKFPGAKVFVAPDQWSWPINLPPQLFGIFPYGMLKDEDVEAPWSEEIEQKIFRPPDVGRVLRSVNV